MAKLVNEIEASRFAIGLFGWTYLHDLCIAQTAVTYPYDGPYLRVSPLTNGKLEFRYIDTSTQEKQWNRTVAADKGFARLERFIHQLHWLV